MKVVKHGKHIKTVAAKFSPILDSFKFDSETKRPTSLERDRLNICLTIHKIQEYFHSGSVAGVQFQYAKEASSVGIISSVERVKKRDGEIKYNVKFEGKMAITVGYNLMCNYPEYLILDKNEF